MDGKKFNPISNYNQYLHNSESFKVDESGNDFETILNQQTQAIQNPLKIQGGVELNNIDDVTSRAVVEAPPADSAGNFLNSFSNAVTGGMNNVNNQMDAANKAQEAFAMGEDVSVHDVMISAEKAQLSFQMAMQLRNKIMNAYTELNSIKV